MPPPPIPLLDLDTHKARVQGRLREMTVADVEQAVDLSKVAVDLGSLGTLSPASGAAEVERFVDSFFASLEPTPSAT